MRRFVLLALFVAVAWPAAANAATPCRNKIYNDWYGDGKIATTYPIACYRDALRHVKPDAAIYSSLVDDIKSALQGALERRHGDTKVPKEIGRGLESLGKGAVKGKDVTLHPSRSKTRTSATTSRNQQVNDVTTVASASPSGGSSGVPTPIIVLGAIALALAAIGAAGTGYRRFHRRR